jgi:hypothetical protein
MDNKKRKSKKIKNGEGLMKKDKHTIRFLEWIRRYPGWWYLICTPNNEHMNVSMMKLLIKRLAKEQFYEMIFVLLMVHRNADFMDSVFKTILLELILSGWKGEVKEKNQIIHDFIVLLT